MSDTVEILQLFNRRMQLGLTGRVEHDERGNAVWVRSRSTDAAEVTINSDLAIVEDSPPRALPHEFPAAKLRLRKAQR